MEPEPLGGGHLGERIERVDRAGVHGSRRADEQRRQRAGRPVGRNRAAQRVRVETPAGQRHRPDGVGAEPEQFERARHAAVRLGGHVCDQARTSNEPAPAHVVPGGRAGAAARTRQADDRRRGRAAGEKPGARCVRVAHELRQPAHGRALEVDVGMVARHHARVHRGGWQRRQHTGQRRRGVDPAEEGRVAVAHGVRQHVARHRCRQRLEPRRPVRQRQLEQRRAQIVRQRLPDRPSRQRLEVVGQSVDQHMAGTPELVQIAGAEPAGVGVRHSGSLRKTPRRLAGRFCEVEAAGTAPASAEHHHDACYERSRRSRISATGSVNPRGTSPAPHPRSCPVTAEGRTVTVSPLL